MDRKLLKLSVAATILVALVLTGGSGVAVAQVVASATGSGQIHVSGALRTFTFNAQIDSSGVTTGQTEAFNRSSGEKWHGTIDCLSIVGNVATMSGTVTDVSPASPPFFVVGSHILFQVIDNGEGSNPPPDLISLTFFYGIGNGPACNAAGLGIFATIPVEHGNVQVH